MAGCATVLALCGAVGALNYAIDPLWIRGRDGDTQRLYVPVDMRLQRVNAALQRRGAGADKLVLGSSRTGNYGLSDPAQTVNFSVHSMLPAEYLDAITTADRINGRFDHVFIGLDFPLSSAHYLDLHPRASAYLERVDSVGYRVKATIAISTLKASLRTWLLNRADDAAGCDPCYDGHYRFTLGERSHENLQDYARQQLQRYRQRSILYRFNPSLPKVLHEVAHGSGRDRTLAFVTPEHADLQVLLSQLGFEGDQERFISTAVGAFGKVLVFLPDADAWRSNNTFFDLHHPLPSTVRRIESCLDRQGQSCHPSLGARLVTPRDLDAFLGEYRSSRARLVVAARHARFLAHAPPATTVD